jgi:hypothetical protein
MKNKSAKQPDSQGESKRPPLAPLVARYKKALGTQKGTVGGKTQQQRSKIALKVAEALSNKK